MTKEITAEEQQWRAYWKQQEAEARSEDDYDPVGQEYKYKCFVSKSNGRGRKPRKKHRDIEFATNRETGQTFQLKDIPVGRLDTVAQALLGHLGDDVNLYDQFLTRLRSQAIK